MSYEVFVHFAEPIAERAAIAPWQGAAARDPLGFWVVDIDGQNSFTLHLHLDDQGEVGGLTVGRPCGSLGLWDGLVLLLRLGKGVAYAPREELVAWVVEPGALRALPAYVREAFTQEVVVSSGTDLRDRVES